MLARPHLSTPTERLLAWACAILLGLLAWTGLILGIIALL